MLLLWEAVTSPGNRDAQINNLLTFNFLLCSWYNCTTSCSQPHFCITVLLNLLIPLKILMLFWDPLTSPCRCLGMNRNTPKAQHLPIGWWSLQSVVCCCSAQRFPCKSHTLIQLLRLWILSVTILPPFLKPSINLGIICTGLNFSRIITAGNCIHLGGWEINYKKSTKRPNQICKTQQ